MLALLYRHNKRKIVQFLVASGAYVNAVVIGDDTPLIRAAWNGHLDVVKYLIESGADVNKTVRDGYHLRSEKRNPLKMAKRGQHTEVIDYLIHKGAKN